MPPLQVKDPTKTKLEKLVNTLEKYRFEDSVTLEGEYVYCGYKKDNQPPQEDAGWKKVDEMTRFTGVDEHFWLHYEFETPTLPKNKEVRFSLLTGREGGWDAHNPQAIIYVDGKNVQALDINHTWYPLESGRKYDMYIYMYCGMAGGMFEADARLLTVDLDVERLYFDMLVPTETLNVLSEKSRDFVATENALDKASFIIDMRDLRSETYYSSIRAASEYLNKEYYNKICGGDAPTISCIGHTHIDVAWRWTVAQTREKAQRSFSTVLALMDRYPNYKFMSSQPQLYQHVKEEDPELYEKIKQRIKEGRWEVEGAMWLEADCNLISGESMVRQLLHGKRFMRDEFGVESRMLWLPDVFGYSGALPQVLRKAGVDRFFTTKIAWNDTNRLPHDTFIWEGIDGSEVFTTMIDSYVNKLNADIIYKTEEVYKDKRLVDNSLVTFGHGDGGGGTTPEMVEQYERFKYGLPGMPKVKMEKAGEFFDTVEKQFKESTKELRKEPRWIGELYLEMHRGTYTTVAKNKKNNRKSEFLYQNAETLSVMDMLFNGGKYPTDTLYKNQINILLNQFHDIIPGSSIKEVYDDTDVEYARILSEGRAIADEKLASIAKNIKTSGGVLVYNPAPYKQSGLVNVDGKSVYAKDVPAHGWSVVAANEAKNIVSVSDKCLENDVIKVIFDDKYEIVSVYDKEAGREVVLGGGSCNRFEVFEDYPHVYDAWEISKYYKDKKWIIDDVSSVKLLDDGIAIERSYLNSKIWQNIRLREGSKRIDFETKIDWHEDHVLLKTAFDVDVHSTYATYETQFGHVTRPTHSNTSWDEAKFEVCAHKWADLSENGYGVSLLNDCKYGHITEKNTMKLTLLKASTDPYKDADRHMHEFVYSMYPHEGDWRDAGTIQESFSLNVPLEAISVGANDGKLADNYSFVSCDKENVILETIKKAEDSDEIIVRMYEAYNSKCNATIKFGFDVDKAYVCNLLEEGDEEIEVVGNSVTIPMRNFEIVTLKIKTK